MQRYLSFFLVILLFALGVLIVYQSSSNNPTKVLREIEANLATQIEYQSQDLDLFIEQLNIYSNPFDISSDQAFQKRVYIAERLVYWSDTELLPGLNDLDIDTLAYVTFKDNHYVVFREDVGEEATVSVFSFLHLSIDPPITNQYLYPKLNAKVFDSFGVTVGKGSQIRIMNRIKQRHIHLRVREQPKCPPEHEQHYQIQGLLP